MNTYSSPPPLKNFIRRLFVFLVILNFACLGSLIAQSDTACGPPFCITTKNTPTGLLCAYDLCITLTPKVGNTCNLSCSPAPICVRFEAGSKNETKCIKFPLGCFSLEDCPLTQCFNIQMTFTPVYFGIVVANMDIHHQNKLGTDHFLNVNGTWTGRLFWDNRDFSFLNCGGNAGWINITTTDGYNYIFEDGFWLGGL